MNRPAQILTELLIALGVATVAIVGLVQVATRSLSNASFSKQQSQATAYASAGQEWVRSQRSEIGWDQFLAKSSDSGNVYCLNDLNWTPGPCGTSEIGSTGYIREVTLTQISPNMVEAALITSWQDGSRDFSSKQVARYSKSGEVIAENIPTQAPTPTPSAAPPPACLPDNSSCTRDSQCCSDDCSGRRCRAASGGGSGGSCGGLCGSLGPFNFGSCSSGCTCSGSIGVCRN